MAGMFLIRAKDSNGPAILDPVSGNIELFTRREDAQAYADGIAAHAVEEALPLVVCRETVEAN